MDVLCWAIRACSSHHAASPPKTSMRKDIAGPARLATLLAAVSLQPPRRTYQAASDVGIWTHLGGGGDEEVLLLEPELLALIRPVIWVQHAAQGLCSLPGQHRLYSPDVLPMPLSRCHLFCTMSSTSLDGCSMPQDPDMQM